MSAVDYVPPRWTRAAPLGKRANAWITARPQRLLVLWELLFLLGVTGLALTVVALFTDGWLLVPGLGLVVVGWLNLAPDVRYIPRARSAWRQTDGVARASNDQR